MTNPYGAPDVKAQVSDVPTYYVPTGGSYAAPDLAEGAPYIKALGWSPTLARGGSTTDLPSSQRLMTIPLMDERPRANRPPEEYWDQRDADKAHRTAVESVTAYGGTEVKDRYVRGVNPYTYGVPETRPTQQLNPHQYTFTRPYDQFNRTHDGDPLTGTARQFNGFHFSMADHRRTYPIGGMSPVPTRRNTYRVEPTPWDVNVVDMPPAYTVVSADITSVDVLPQGGAYRLG